MTGNVKVELTPADIQGLIQARTHLFLTGVDAHVTDPLDRILQNVVIARIDGGRLHSVDADSPLRQGAA